MSNLIVRPARAADIPRLTEIYNHYVVNSPITFDLEPYTVERRMQWFSQFGLTGRHRLLVVEVDGLVLGYAGTTRFSSQSGLRHYRRNHHLLQRG